MTTIDGHPVAEDTGTRRFPAELVRRLVDNYRDKTLDHAPGAMTEPASVFTDPERFRREKNLLFDRGEARRIATDAVCERDVRLAECREPGEVDQQVRETLAREECPEWRGLVGDVRLTDARGEDRLASGEIARLLLLLAHEPRDLRIETLHLGFECLQFRLRLLDDGGEAGHLARDVGERGRVLRQRRGGRLQLRLEVLLLCDERVQRLLLRGELRGELLLSCERIVELVGANG